MNKVTTINLNGNAYQIEETGFDTLRRYLDQADRSLSANPDRAEILTDIEQAIAEKFSARLGPHKTVVLSPEVTEVLAEMGPVQDASGAADPAGPAMAGAAAASGPGAETAAPGPQAASPRAGKQLFKIREGSMIGGVCTGIAAYLNLNVTLVRILAVLLCCLYGSGLLIYLLLLLLLPEANTATERAAAYGIPSTAEEFVRRARAGYYQGMKTLHDREAHRAWRRSFREEMRGWKRTFRWQARHGWAGYPGSAAPSAARGFGIGLGIVLLWLPSLALTLLAVAAAFLLVTTRSVGPFVLPPHVPLWVALVGVMVLYQVVSLPLRAARYALWCHGGYGRYPGHGGGLVWLGVFAIGLWYANRHVPEVHTALESIRPKLEQACAGFQQWLAKN